MPQQIENDLWLEFEEELNKIQNQNSKILFPEKTQHLEFWDKFLNEKFPEGEINRTLEKNFAVWILHNKLGLETIQEKYKQQGWKIGGLMGWIKKVQAGEILQYSPGELVNWAKEYKPEFLELLKDKPTANVGVREDLKIVWANELATWENPNVDWLIEKLIPFKSVGVWTGKRGTFKTFLVLCASYCISQGIDFLGQYKTKPIKVLYLDKENGLSILKPRSKMIEKGLNLTQENTELGFMVFPQLKIDQPTDLWNLGKLIEENNIGLLVIDTYRRAVSFDENNASEVSALFVDLLRPLVEKYNLSIILIHHNKKGSSENSDEMDQLRGSSDLANYCDFILQNERKGKYLVLKQLKCRNSPEINPIEIQVQVEEDKSISFVAKGDYVIQTAEEKATEIILLWINQNKIKNFTTSQVESICTEKGVKRQNFFNALNTLTSSGQIEKNSKGSYKVLESQEDWFK